MTTVSREFSLAHLTVLGCAPPEMTYIAARAGYEYVSMRLMRLGLPGEPDHGLVGNRSLFRQTKRALESTGVRLHDVELVRIGDGSDLRRHEPTLEIAAELGARAVLTSIWTADRPLAIDALSQLCDLARPYGLTADLEYVPIAAVRNLAEALEVIQAVERDNVGVVIDTHHFHRAGDRPQQLDRVPRSWVHFAQICDAPAEIPFDRDEMLHIIREARLDLGTGGIDVPAILAHLPRVVLSIEQPNVERASEMGYAEHAARCLEAARRCLGERAGEPQPL